MSTPSVTVLLCVHSQTARNDALLVQALGSLRRQTLREFDTVVVLDECWQHTAIALQQPDVVPPRTRVLVKPTPKAGLAHAKNYGLAHISTEWVAFLDADDQYLPCKLEAQLAWAAAHPDTDVIATQVLVCQDGNWPSNTVSAPANVQANIAELNTITDSEQIHSILPASNVLTHGSVLIRRSVLHHVDGYNLDARGKEDHDLWLRARAAGYRFGKVPEPLYVWSHGSSVPI